MLRKLASIGTFMETDAHPDDEDNGLLAMLGHGQGMRTVLVTATRGDGGQNEIGPELFQSLGVLRTEELLAVHRFDGAEQFFTRAVDFGFSFSVEESIQKWGHDEIVGDYVRHIRALRPDVIAGFLCGGEGGGQHHQASARLTVEAFRAAADPDEVPRTDQRRSAAVAGTPRFLHRHERLRARASASPNARSADGGRDRLRSGARPNLQRAGHRSALDAQVPGHVAAAAASGSGVQSDLSPARQRHRSAWSRAGVAVRGDRHHAAGTRSGLRANRRQTI